MHKKLVTIMFLAFKVESDRILKYFFKFNFKILIAHLKITNNCRIGPRCELMTNEELKENTCLCFEFGQRKNAEQSTNVFFFKNIFKN